MSREALIQKFCQIVNEGLELEAGEQAYTSLKDNVSEENQPLLIQLLENYRQAYTPTEFITRQIEVADTSFEQAYELHRITFDSSVLVPREAFARNYRQSSADQKPRRSYMFCHSFRVS